MLGSPSFRMTSSRIVPVRSRGFTLVETLIGLLILSLIATTSLAVFYGRQLRLRRADETVVAYQILAIEAEVARHVPFSSLSPGSRPFFSQSDLAARLKGVEATIDVDSQFANVKLLTLTVRWSPDRTASLLIVRAETGGGNLF